MITNDFVNDFDEISRSGEIGRSGKIGHPDKIVERFKFKFKFLTDNTMKLIWGYLTMNIGRSGEIVFDEIVVKFKFNAIGGGGAP